MQIKSLKHGLMVLNAYLDMGTVVIKATKTYINNPKILNAMEVADKAIKESAREMANEHAEEIQAAISKISEAEAYEEETKEDEGGTTH